MYGAAVALLVGACFSFFGGLSWWWEFAWFFGGMLMEFAIRIGAGEEAIDALSGCVTAGIELSGPDSGGSTDYSSSDYSSYSDGGGGDSGGGGGCD